eukprot:1755179-Amphidinium_carterae.1
MGPGAAARPGPRSPPQNCVRNRNNAHADDEALPLSTPPHFDVVVSFCLQRLRWAEVLRSAEQLQEIDFGRNQDIGDEGAKAIAAALL